MVHLSGYYPDHNVGDVSQVTKASVTSSPVDKVFEALLDEHRGFRSEATLHRRPYGCGEIDESGQGLGSYSSSDVCSNCIRRFTHRGNHCLSGCRQ